MTRTTKRFLKSEVDQSFTHPFEAHEVALQSMIRLQPITGTLDSKAVNEIVKEAYGAAVRAATGFFNRLGLRPAEEWGREAVHELLCQLRPHAAKGYQPDRPLFPYVYSALFYTCVGMAKKESRSRGVPLSFEVADAVTDSAQSVAIHEVDELLALLPEGLRRVLQLRYLDGLSSRKTAVALSISTNAVDTRAHRARQWLKTHVK